MGGQIGAAPNSPRGARFWFELPLREVLEMEPVTAVSTPRTFAARVLLVEDHPVNRKIAVRMLGQLGCQVEVAADGQEAIERCAQDHFDAVLMDCFMPRVDGFAAAATIRIRESPGQHMPIIAITASVLEADRQRCREAGMDDFLAKPIDPRQLEEVLGRWLPAATAA
jgi:hypothetical protein